MAVYDLHNKKKGAKASGWGNSSGSNGSNGPPDLDEVFRKQKKKLENIFGGNRGGGSGGGGSGGGGPGGGGSGRGSGGTSLNIPGGLLPILGLVALIAIGLFIYTAYYTVPSLSLIHI